MKKIPSAIRSMTAYGEAISPKGDYHVIIQSVNRRFLEITFGLPSAMTRFESELRKWITSEINRGQVNVNVAFKQIDDNVHIAPNLTLAQGIKRGCDAISEKLGMSKALSSELTLSLLSQQKDLFSNGDILQTISLSSLEEVVMAALKAHCEMRENEGRALQADIAKRLEYIAAYLQKIDDFKEQVVVANREKMRRKLAELFEGDIDERVLKEAALLSEKVDITEEIVRFQALLKEFETTLNRALDSHESKGKKLEFYLQELSREVNTIGSKAMNVEIAKHVVEIKSELEKIREQVQNIE